MRSDLQGRGNASAWDEMYAGPAAAKVLACELEASAMHAGLLRPRKTVHPENLVVSVPLPHTAVISQPRNLEVHINFDGLDHVLGAYLCFLMTRLTEGL